MRVGILIVLCVLMNTSILAQEFSLDGKVYDKSGQVLPGAHLILNQKIGTATDADGAFAFKLKPGKYELLVRMLGYSDYRSEIRITNQSVNLNIQLDSKEELLEDVVISAGKGINRRKEVVVSMELIRPDMLTLSAPTTMEDAVKITPGLNVADGQASIRGGAGYSYGAGSRVLLLYDGLPMLSADAGDIKWNLIPLQHIERVEVVKGASSSLYGSGALNGVINVISAWPEAQPKTNLKAMSGFYLKPARDELFWFKDSLRFVESIGLSHSRQIGRFDLQFGIEQMYDTRYRTYTYEKRQNGNFKLRYRPAKIQGLTLGIGSLVSNQDASGFFLWQNAAEGAYLQDSSLANPVASFRLVLDPFVNYSRNDWHHSFKSRYYFNSNNNSDDSKDNRFNSFYSEYLINKTFKENWKFTGGLHVSASSAISNLFDNHSASGLAAFLQTEKRLQEKIRLVAGIRLESFQLDNDLELSHPLFRFGANYEISPGGNLRISFGQAYRYPTIAEKFTYTSVGALQILPNPHLMPETGRNAELGFRQEFKLNNWKGYGDVALFYTEYSNMMEFTFGVVDSITYLPIYDITQFGTNPVGFQSRNIGQAEISGLELSGGLQYQAGAIGLQWIGGYSYLNPIDANTDSLYNAWKSEETNLLKYRFRHSANSAVSFSYRKIEIAWVLIYTSKIVVIDKFFELGIILPGLKDYRANHDKGFFNNDLSFSYRWNQRFKLGLTCRNLMNREQMIRPGDLAAPRMILIQLDANF
jgi:outer membrane receptor protein involved in Fe transport